MVKTPYIKPRSPSIRIPSSPYEILFWQVLTMAHLGAAMYGVSRKQQLHAGSSSKVSQEALLADHTIWESAYRSGVSINWGSYICMKDPKFLGPNMHMPRCSFDIHVLFRNPHWAYAPTPVQRPQAIPREDTFADLAHQGCCFVCQQLRLKPRIGWSYTTQGL